MYAYNELLYENTKAYSPVGSGVHRNSERVRSAKRARPPASLDGLSEISPRKGLL